MTGAEHLVQLSGRLTIETTAEFFNRGLLLKEGERNLVYDFAEVEAVDSSAVSLMLAWLRSAQRRNMRLSFINVPDNLLSLAGLYGVSEALSLNVKA